MPTPGCLTCSRASPATRTLFSGILIALRLTLANFAAYRVDVWYAAVPDMLGGELELAHFSEAWLDEHAMRSFGPGTKRPKGSRPLAGKPRPSLTASCADSTTALRRHRSRGLSSRPNSTPVSLFEATPIIVFAPSIPMLQRARGTGYPSCLSSIAYHAISTGSRLASMCGFNVAYTTWGYTTSASTIEHG